jgi:type I restriction enzyme S subunit
MLIAAPRQSEEQQRIVAVLTLFGRTVHLEKKQLETLRMIKSGLMHDLLTGKVPVKVDEEVESA